MPRSVIAEAEKSPRMAGLNLFPNVFNILTARTGSTDREHARKFMGPAFSMQNIQKTYKILNEKTLQFFGTLDQHIRTNSSSSGGGGGGIIDVDSMLMELIFDTLCRSLFNLEAGTKIEGFNYLDFLAAQVRREVVSMAYHGTNMQNDFIESQTLFIFLRAQNSNRIRCCVSRASEAPTRCGRSSLVACRGRATRDTPRRRSSTWSPSHSRCCTTTAPRSQWAERVRVRVWVRVR